MIITALVIVIIIVSEVIVIIIVIIIKLVIVIIIARPTVIISDKSVGNRSDKNCSNTHTNSYADSNDCNTNDHNLYRYDTCNLMYQMTESCSQLSEFILQNITEFFHDDTYN